jgi:uncharacterized RDD family membrane protein YckC
MTDEHWHIDTPENVAFDYEVAGIGSRFLAALVDTLLILILQVIVILAVTWVTNSMGVSVSESDLLPWMLALFGLIAFFFLWGYYVFFELIWNGQSPGKRWVGLRVIQIDGTPITLTESLIRNLVRLVDFLPAYYGVGVVAMFVNQQARRLGDLAAGTLVVRDRETVTLASLAAAPPRQARPVPAGRAEWPIERLTSEEIELAENFLRRRDQLAGRTTVAQRIARALLVRMEVPVDDQVISLSAERIIERVVQASRGSSETSSG